MQLGVKVVGLSAGLSIGQYGATHMSVEDVSLMRSLPNIVVLSPADCTETAKALMAAATDPRPTYIRLSGWMNCPIVYKKDYDYQIGKAITLREGEDIAIIATGPMVYNSLKAADMLAADRRVVVNADINAADKYGRSALMRAAWENNVGKVKSLIILGANVNAAAKNGLTPLMVACIVGNVDIAGRLIAAGANVNATTQIGMTALMYAAQYRQVEIANTLLANGADADVAMKNGWNALDFALWKKSAISQVLRDRGVSQGTSINWK